jgi:hypothetical protein
MPRDVVHVAAKVPPDLADDFRAKAKAEDRTVSSLLRVAMRRCLNERGPDCEEPRPRSTAGQSRNSAG